MITDAEMNVLTDTWVELHPHDDPAFAELWETDKDGSCLTDAGRDALMAWLLTQVEFEKGTMA